MDASGKDLLAEISLSKEEIIAIQALGDKAGLLEIVASRFQRAVESLVPAFYNQKDNDSLGHWWRRVGEFLGEIEGVDSETFWGEYNDGKTTLDHETAVKIGRVTKKYLLGVLEDGKKGKELPSWGSVLQQIYDPPIHEIAQIVNWSKD